MIHGVAVCAGVGGSQLALRLLFGERFRTVLYVEREAAAAALLVARMEDQALDRAPIWDDLGSAPGLAYRGRVDLVTAGLPCQPYSLAGKRAGNDDERALWPDFVRFVEQCEPGALFFENVPDFINHFEGAWRVLRDLGFEFAPPVQAAAADFAAHHRRERVYFFCAHPGRARLEEWARFAEDARAELAAAQRVHHGAGPWAGQPPLLGVADGPAYRVDRLRGIGNSVVPQAVAAVLHHQLQWLVKHG